MSQRARTDWHEAGGEIPQLRHAKETPNQLRRRVEELRQQYPDTAEVVHTFPNGHTVQRLHTHGDVYRTGTIMRNCWQPKPWGEAFKPKEPLFNIGRNEHYTINDPSGIPHTAFNYSEPQDYDSVRPHVAAGHHYIHSAFGPRNRHLQPEQVQMLEDWASSLGGPIEWRRIKKEPYPGETPDADEAIQGQIGEPRNAAETPQLQPEWGKEDWQPGDTAHFEYHCNPSHDSPDAPAWYRSHQPVTIVGRDPNRDDADQFPEMSYQERAQEGVPKVYRARFPDGLEWDVFEDELFNHPSFYSPEMGPPNDRKTSTATTMYHVAPRSARESIMANGIDRSQGMNEWSGDAHDPGNYLFDNIENAYRYAEMLEELEQDNYGRDAQEYDVWQVDPSGLELASDPQVNDIDPNTWQELGYVPGKSMYSDQPIPPQRLRLLSDEHMAKVGMADRSGIPEIDNLIEMFLQQRPGDWTYSEPGETMEQYRDPSQAHGNCQVISEQFAEFAKQHGFRAYVTNTDTEEMGYKPTGPGGEIGFDENDEMQYGHYPEHTIVTIVLPGTGYGREVYIDWTATQYGYTDHPKVTSKTAGAPEEWPIERALAAWDRNMGDPEGNKLYHYDGPYLDRMKDYVSANGLMGPILMGTWATGEPRIEDGHHRLWVAKQLGYTHVPVRMMEEEPGEPEHTAGARDIFQETPGWGGAHSVPGYVYDWLDQAKPGEQHGFLSDCVNPKCDRSWGDEEQHELTQYGEIRCPGCGTLQNIGGTLGPYDRNVGLPGKTAPGGSTIAGLSMTEMGKLAEKIVTRVSALPCGQVIETFETPNWPVDMITRDAHSQNWGVEVKAIHSQASPRFKLGDATERAKKILYCQQNNLRQALIGVRLNFYTDQADIWFRPQFTDTYLAADTMQHVGTVDFADLNPYRDPKSGVHNVPLVEEESLPF